MRGLNSGAGIFAAVLAGLVGAPCVAQDSRPPRREGTLTYATVQNSGDDTQVGGNFAALQFSDDPSAAFYGCYKNRKPDKRAGGALVRAGDDLCEFQANGWDGTTYNTSGTIDFAVDGTPAANAVPTSFAVWLGQQTGSGVSQNQLALLIDSHANAYLRNGNLGIGSAFGYNPPLTYSAGRAPPFPLTIAAPDQGTAFAAFQAGSTAGGARINVGHAYSSTSPVYAFWGDPATGIGNPAPGTVSLISDNREVMHIDRAGVTASGPVTTETLRLRPIHFAALPPCDRPHAGTLAYITDAPEAVTAWHQRVQSGGGAHQAFLACNGEAWHAFDG